MSTFGGRIPEFPGLMIDRFEVDTTVKAYFLSHDHTDHQAGIHDADLQTYIVENQIKIYASPLTVRMVRNRQKFETLHDNFHPLELDIPHRIQVDTDEGVYTVTVTLTSAEHIVGSVMFLYEREKPNFRCLYTGDFRLTKQDLKLKKCFKLHRGVKPIDAVYFDSTWCMPNNLWNIPTREEVLRYVEPLVDGHLQKDKSNIISIRTWYDVGYENLLQALAKVANSKIHVTKRRLQLYHGFTGITDLLTTDPNCRVHFCQIRFGGGNESCWRVRRELSSGRLIKLEFSYKRFIDEHTENQEQNIYVQNKHFKNVYSVCWSTHPSLEEVSDLLKYLSPDRVHANVIPDTCSEIEILNNLKRGSILPKKWHPSESSQEPKPGSTRKHTQESTSQSSYSTDDSPSESLLDHLRKKGCFTKREASPTPSLALLGSATTKELL